MSWGWKKYRENHAQEQRPVLPPVAEPVPTEPATPPPEVEENAGNYPWDSVEDSD